MIGISAFERCFYLTEVLLHEGLTTIEDRAFGDCDRLCSITIPKSVHSIGKEVFSIQVGSLTWRLKNSKLVISCYAGSYGLEYARREGYKVQNAAK